MRTDLLISGFGGQGVLLAGNLISCAAIAEGKNVSFFPSYGVEKRGGAAMCTVVIAEGKVGSPVIGNPSVFISLDQSSLNKHEKSVKPGGIIVFNSSLIDRSSLERSDLEIIAAPLNDIAMALGDSRMVNMVAAGIYVSRTGAVAVDSLSKSLSEVLPERNHKYIPANIKAIEAGVEFDRKVKGC